MSNKSKRIERDLKKLEDLTATYKQKKEQLLKGERILRQISLKKISLERLEEKANIPPGLLKKLKEAIKNGGKEGLKLNRVLTEISDEKMRISKRIRKYEKKISKINQNLIERFEI